MEPNVRPSLVACLAILVCACGDSPSGPAVDARPAPDADTTDDAAPPTDALVPTDAPSCTAPPPGQVGGACTVDVDCDSVAAAGDGLCLDEDAVGFQWPAQGYCLSRVSACATDSECGAGNVCVDLGGGARACMVGCAGAPCVCPDGMICSRVVSGVAVDRDVCAPGDRAAIDGTACADIGDCDEGSRCRADVHEHPGGQCAQVGCTPGDDGTCTSGGDGHCVTLLGASRPECVDRCDTSADCRAADGYICFDAGGATGKYCRHPQIGDPCALDTDCGDDARWQCLTGVTYPGGYCTVQQACPAGGAADGCAEDSSVCHDPLVGPNYCVDRCTGTGQGTCRSGYTCVSQGSVRGCIPVL